jgi:type II secretory pathway predicted ATPase ExeA
LIHQVSRGLPRAVNNLAIQALVATQRRTAVTEVTAE